LGAHHDGLAPLRPAKLVLARDGTVGEALRLARESLGLAVEDIALVTRVRAQHLAALEAFELERLPARPFAVGYLRAYAQALGLDPEAVVARFRAEAPREDTALRAPGGAPFEGSRHLRGLAVAAGVVIAGVLAWNLLLHAKAKASLARPAAAARAAPAEPAPGPAVLGVPLPAPPEATTPPAYETPGLAASVARSGSPDAAAAAAKLASAASAGPASLTGPIGARFASAGAVYGAASGGSGVVLQARRSISLVVRGPGGVVYFARQLAPGEAWRAPAIGGLTVDVSDPAATEVFVAGLSKGPLAQAQTPLARIAD
jgi:transcriptional regulator with XRE-family HTH domain